LLKGGATVGAEERSEASAAEEPNKEDAARGRIGETKPGGPEIGCWCLRFDEPGAEEGATGRRGKRSPAEGMEFEFAGGREEFAAGREESEAKEEETVASTVVLVLGILARKEKRNKAEAGP
jgi:hypothetical protein